MQRGAGAMDSHWVSTSCIYVGSLFERKELRKGVKERLLPFTLMGPQGRHAK